MIKVHKKKKKYKFAQVKVQLVDDSEYINTKIKIIKFSEVKDDALNKNKSSQENAQNV